MTNVDDERRGDTRRRPTVAEYPETHQVGMVQLHDAAEIQAMIKDLGEVDLGVQIATDGRVWVCINGRAFLRFKPNRAQPWVEPSRLVRFLRWITLPLRGW